MCCPQLSEFILAASTLPLAPIFDDVSYMPTLQKIAQVVRKHTPTNCAQVYCCADYILAARMLYGLHLITATPGPA